VSIARTIWMTYWTQWTWPNWGTSGGSDNPWGIPMRPASLPVDIKTVKLQINVWRS
jgi:hypothetical protein